MLSLISHASSPFSRGKPKIHTNGLCSSPSPPFDINPQFPNVVYNIRHTAVQKLALYKKSTPLLVVGGLGPRISAPARQSRDVDGPLPRARVAAVVPTVLSIFEGADAPCRGRKHRRRSEAHANQSPRRALEVAPGHACRNLIKSTPDGFGAVSLGTETDGKRSRSSGLPVGPNTMNTARGVGPNYRQCVVRDTTTLQQYKGGGSKHDQPPTT